MKVFKKTSKPLSQEEIVEWLRELRGNPYVPSSGFDVTSVFRVKVGDEDTYYCAGTNVENPHHRLSTHGEEGSIAAMVTGLGKHAQIVEGWVMGAPKKLIPGSDDPLADNCVSCCGKCRQQIAGFASPSVVMHSVSLNGATKSTTVGDFLPDAFTFRDFAPELTSASAQQTDSVPTVSDVESRLVRKGKELSANEIDQWLESLESFDLASKQSQAVILKLANGAYVAGVKVEDAAYVSIDPVQSAMAIAQAEFGHQKVLEVHTLAKGRDEAAMAPEAFTPLSGSAIQVLGQFAAHADIPVHMYNAAHESRVIKLKDSARYLPTFERPSMPIGVERFVG